MVVGWQSWRDSLVNYLFAVALNVATLWALPVSSQGRRHRPQAPLTRVVALPAPATELLAPYRLDDAGAAFPAERLAATGAGNLDALLRRTYPLRPCGLEVAGRWN